MLGTAATQFRWLKMTNLKKCKPYNCSCVKKLTLLYVTKPKTKYDEIKLDRNIDMHENTYIKCLKKSR